MKVAARYITLFLFLYSGLHSQSPTFQITNGEGPGGLVSTNEFFYHNTSPIGTIEHNFEIKNISSSTQTISIRKTENLLNTVAGTDKAEAFFCTGVTCYVSQIMTGSMVVAPGQVAIFKAQLVEASITGESSVSYKFANNVNNGENIFITIKYNDVAHPVSVAETPSSFFRLSGVFPNPSTSTMFLNVQSDNGKNGVRLVVLNSLGSEVLSKEINLTAGKNTIPVERGDLAPGIYFVSLGYRNLHVTKRIILIN